MAIIIPSRLGATRDTSPFLLTSGPTPMTLTITNQVAGAPIQIPTQDFVNTLRVPIEITELSFNAVVNRGSTDQLPWEISLNVGKHLICSNCPLYVLGTQRDSWVDERSQSTERGATQRRWIFGRPLILAPNEGLSGTIRCAPSVPLQSRGTYTTNMVIVARGRRLPSGTPVPRVRAIPYASGVYIIRAGGVPDTTLRNTFSATLHVTHLGIGMAPGSGGGRAAVPGPDAVAATFAQQLVRVNAPGGLSHTAVRGLLSSQNYGLAFTQRSGIEVAHDLNPNDMYTFTVPAFVAATDPHSALAVGLNGWREE